ncbi:MAG TPA: GNAT family N-acetyltransferase [Blastocatellia bacterium]|nr:GNAT family N-acetyltransferase [Blastocatellia bacterium]
MVDPAITTQAIRPATERDAVEIARLLTTLGHSTTVESIVTRWNEWRGEGNLALVASSPDGALAGLVTLHHMLVLHRPLPVGRITALIVDPSSRGRGIGRALVAAAEEALTRSGCGLLEITSNQRLTDAHRFYERLGYEQTSTRFAKALMPID